MTGGGPDDLVIFVKNGFMPPHHSRRSPVRLFRMRNTVFTDSSA